MAAVTCTELMLSRRITEGVSAEFLYLIQGTANEATALAAVLAVAGAEYVFPAGSGSGSGSGDVTLPRLPVEIEPLYVDSVSDTGLWEARVRFEDTTQQQQPPQENESSFSFDTTGGTQKVTQSIATVRRAGIGGSGSGDSPDNKGAIGFDGKKVEGCEITVPVYKFTETHFKGATYVTDAYKVAVMLLTGKVNASAFKGFAAGEVLFLGASGARRGRHSTDMWELTFHFAVSENEASFTLAGISLGAKKGWEYAWVLYEDGVDSSAMSRVRVPKAAYIEQVYKTGDFGTLGIGT